MKQTANNLNTEALILKASDGYPISATRYNVSGKVRGHLIVAGATGVRQEFYRRFAQFCRAHGYTTLTLDYRGIGRSRPASLKKFEMNFLDWGTLDLAAAVEEMASDHIPLFMVGHSFGGHAFGLLPNHHRVKGFYTFATGAGWHGWMPFLESVRVRFMWNVLLPVLTKWKGYSPWAMLRMGEDLPLGVYRQWRHWCRFPHYFFDDPETPHMAAIYSQVTAPIVAASSLDDLWALPASRDAFMQAYTHAPVEAVDIDPKPFPAGIGHMGYFRQKAEPLWKNVISFFHSLDENRGRFDESGCCPGA